MSEPIWERARFPGGGRPQNLEELLVRFERGEDVKGLQRISFALTQPQILDGTKDVTRRLGWRNVRPGQLLLGVDKVRGMRKGERSKQLVIVEVLDAHRERLDEITPEDVRREGFAAMSPGDFIGTFCGAMGCEPEVEVTRIELRVLARRRGGLVADRPGQGHQKTIYGSWEPVVVEGGVTEPEANTARLGEELANLRVLAEGAATVAAALADLRRIVRARHRRLCPGAGCPICALKRPRPRLRLTTGAQVKVDPATRDAGQKPIA